MARKTKIVPITTEGRDFGKTFLLTEMPASQAEKWATRALLLAAHSGVNIPQVQGMAAIALVGIQTIMNGVDFKELEPLLDEMFDCIQIIPDLKKSAFARPLIEDDIEEVMTRLQLRDEVLELHLGFSVAGALSTLISETPAKDSSDTQTSSPSPA